MGWISWTFAILLVLPLAFFFVAGLQWWTRSTPLRRIRDLDPQPHPPRAGEEGFLDMVAIHLQTPLAPGHDVELFHCGDELYPRLLDDLRAARELVTWHVFWFRPGRLADRLKGVLTERAEAGVKILLLRDWFGSRPVAGGYWEELRDAGVEVRGGRGVPRLPGRVLPELTFAGGGPGRTALRALDGRCPGAALDRQRLLRPGRPVPEPDGAGGGPRGGRPGPPSRAPRTAGPPGTRPDATTMNCWRAVCGSTSTGPR